MKTRQIMKELLMRLLNRALLLQGPDDVRVVGLSDDFQIAKTIGPKGSVGTVRAEIILKESW